MSAPAHPAETATASALALRDVTWRPAGRRRPTIDHLDLEIPAGQTVLLAGASGSGKSTVLLALAGLLDPQAGDLSGEVTGPPLRGLVLQSPEHGVVAETIGRDVAFGPENLALPRPQIWERVHAALGDLAPDVDERSATLATSGGQLQRVQISGVLALGPGALLLDEPISMLDAHNALEVRDAVAALADGRTVVIAEHRLGPWLDLADRLIVLGPQARVLADGVPRELLARRGAELAAAGLSIPEPAEHSDQVAATAPSEPMRVDPAPEAGAAGAHAPPVLDLHDVALAHPDGSGRLLHEHLDLSVGPGMLAALTGPSGAGKSTLLRVVLGLDEPAAGTVVRPEAPRISSVPQNVEHMFVAGTVREEVTASPWARDEDLAEELLAATDLTELSRANPFAISGGEQHRLAIAAALATRPDLLVLDEPTVGLDAGRRAQVLALIDEARARGCAVVVATHDMDLAARATAHLRLGAGIPALPRAATGRRPLSDRLNQLTMLLIGLLAMIGSFAVDTPLTGLLVLAPIALLSPLTMTSARSAVLRVLPTLLAMLTVAWSVALLSPLPLASAGAWTLALREALRIGALVLPGVLLLASMDATRLGDAMGQILRLPGRLVAGIAAGLAHLSEYRRTWQILMEARRLRGLAPRGSVRPYASATVGLLVTAIRGATIQSTAMDARGFAHAHHRTWAKPSPLTGADVIGLVIGLGLLIWPWVARALV